MTDVTALILAGGRSRRFGTDKARFMVRGRSMIEQILETVAAVVCPVMISLGTETETPLPEERGLRYVTDRYPDAGPLAGLHAGLHAAETPWVLAVACDMPFLTPDVLRTLLDARTPDADAVVAQTPDGRRHPLCACYRRRILSTVEAHLAAETLALHALLDTLETVRIVDLPAGPLRNVNRPSDLAAEDETFR